jgi:hypothetical protein
LIWFSSSAWSLAFSVATVFAIELSSSACSPFTVPFRFCSRPAAA